jgi:hypothetical protein
MVRRADSTPPWRAGPDSPAPVVTYAAGQQAQVAAHNRRCLLFSISPADLSPTYGNARRLDLAGIRRDWSPAP